MSLVRLGKTNLQIHPLVFGTLPLGPLQANLTPEEGGRLIPTHRMLQRHGSTSKRPVGKSAGISSISCICMLPVSQTRLPSGPR